MLALLALSPMTTAIAFGASGTNVVQAVPAAVHTSPLVTATPTCETTEICPYQMDNAYGFTILHNEGINGTGQKIAIVDSCEETDIASDLKAFDSYFGLPNPTLNIYFPQGSCTENYGWGPEIAIDVEWSHAMAPGATINLVVAAEPTFTDLFGAWKYILTNHLGAEISNSWGGAGDACGSSTDKLLTTLADNNITVTASTGDSGAWPPGYGSNPANCLGVLGIGGTSLDINSTGGYISESAWSGGGGGYVMSTKEPSFQSKVKIDDPSKLLGKPDVSADANPYTGVWMYDTPDEGGWSCCWGGTSVSNVLWAGFIGDVNQIRVSNGYSTLGYVNPYMYLSIYGIKGSSALYKADMHDVKTGCNAPLGPQFCAAKGWDAATGLGSYKANALGPQLGDTSSA